MSTHIYKCLFALIMVSGKWRPKHWFQWKLIIKLYYRHDICNSIKQIVKKTQKAKKKKKFFLINKSNDDCIQINQWHIVWSLTVSNFKSF